MAPLLKKCIESWKRVMPDYTIRIWDAKSFDFDSVPFVKGAYEARKWAFVTDYVRMYAIYTEGGFYMDSDVLVMKSYDEFRKYSFVSCQEYQPKMLEGVRDKYLNANNERICDEVPGIGIQAGILGAETGCPYLKECLDFYNSLEFDVEKLQSLVIVGKMARVLEPFGYKYILEPQYLEDSNIMIEAPHVFANMTCLNNESHSWHLYYRGWGKKLTLKQKIRNRWPGLYLFLQLLQKGKLYPNVIKAVFA